MPVVQGWLGPASRLRGTSYSWCPRGLLVVCRVAYERPTLVFGDLITQFRMLAFLLHEFWCCFKCSFKSPWNEMS